MNRIYEKKTGFFILILTFAAVAIVFAAMERELFSDIFLYLMFIVAGISFLVIKKSNLSSKARILQYSAGTFIIVFSAVKIAQLIL